MLPRVDFMDTFSTTNHKDYIEKIAYLIFGTVPKWIKMLFLLRNKISIFFGFNTEMPIGYKEEYRIGGYIGRFKIFSISDTEVILGGDQSHLKFRIFIHLKKSYLNNLEVTTIVQYNNLKGKVYMTAIMPFHKAIIRRLVKNAYVFHS